jgi:spermidine synthase
MYHVAGTAITITVLYLISLFFYHSGYYTQALHRKLWNTILALAFLTTAIAGIFMALQISYKWNIPFVKAILKWHVEIGVSLGVTGIFHFLWHLSYFGNFLNKNETPAGKELDMRHDPFTVSSNLFMIGFTSSSVQILLMRELMIITGGYELISGVFLGSWLLASSAGAAVAGRSSLNSWRKINSILAISPFISLALLVALARIFLRTGEVPSFLGSLVVTLVTLTPFCFVSGFSFVKIMNSARDSNGFLPGKSFSIETTGGIIAGILLAVLTSGLLNTYELFLVISLSFLAYVLLTFIIQQKSGKLVVKILFLLLISGSLISEPDRFFRQVMLPAVVVTGTTDTPYGNITDAEYSGEPGIYYNQRLISYSDDIMEKEEDIHYAMLQRAKNERVLLISGSPGSLFPEILKYDPVRVVFVERDPVLTEAARVKAGTKDKRLIIENKDAFKYIKQSGESFDVIIMLLPPPYTLSINRFYTTEFFEDVRKRLLPGGVFLCSPGPNDNYLNQESINLYSSIYNSLLSVFRFVEPVAGNKLYFIASGEELSTGFCRLAAERGIKNKYVCDAFLSDDLVKSRSVSIKDLMNRDIRQNRTIFPVACFHFQSYNLSKDLNERLFAIIIILVIFIFPFFLVRRGNMLMYCSASALAGFEIIVLLGLQLAAGNMYQLTGLAIASIMGGLALGAGTEKILKKTDLRLTSAILLIFYVVMALSFKEIVEIKASFIPVLIVVISAALPAMLTGQIFRRITSAGQENAGTTYGADLAGSALGFILVSGLSVPAFGIRISILLLAAMILAGILFGTKSNKL